MTDIDPLDQAAYDTSHKFRDRDTNRKGLVALANRMNTNAATLQLKCDRKTDTHHLNIQEARAMMLITGDFSLLKTLAAEVGHAVVPLPTFDFAADSDLLTAWADWSAEFGETAETIKLSLEDGRITQAEVEKARAELVEDFEKGLAMLDVMKGMAEPEEE